MERMRRGRPRQRFLYVAAVAGIGLLPVAAEAQNEPAHAHPEAHMRTITEQIRIPEAMRIEHAELHEALVEASRAPGRVGEAAREVARVLHPHFVREEQIALPPLGLLQDLAHGSTSPQMAAVLPLTDSLTAELPQMLEEHRAIRAALENLATVARAEGQLEYARLAEKIMLHAETEEQVTYPAAILVGELVRLRLGHRE
jgi:hypothetical protein